MNTYAICYTATKGYLFSTIVSAIQARTHSDSSVDVYVCFLGDFDSDEVEQFSYICSVHSVELICAPIGVLEGLHPTYARLFLDSLLPESVEEILYLDGDTQVMSNVDSLVFAAPPSGGAIAVVDPMVFIRLTNDRLRTKIDSWWDASNIPAAIRVRYINAGVIRISRGNITGLRQSIVVGLSDRLPTLRFRDQDAINLALDGRIETVSMSWNFPGFLLGSRACTSVQPKIIHFMSNPRPWNAPFAPWGSKYYLPYRQLVEDFPAIRPYWQRLVGPVKLRYTVQQRFKRLTEGRSWESPNAEQAVTIVESRARLLP